MARAYYVDPGQGGKSLTLVDAPDVTPGRRQVLVRMRAASLNYRDLLVANGFYPGGSIPRCVPCSDGAGEVVALGADCTRFKVGDRVAGTFFQNWIGGPMVDAHTATALGGAIDGVLAENTLFEEDGLVAVPAHLSFEEAATLPCAAVTTWNALYGLNALRPGQTVLLLGTGGVSIFGLQFAKAAGARIIITSSSDEKLERARAMGAHETINYRTNPNWAETARALTGGVGVDCVIETGGPGTLQASIAATRRGGSVNLIGVLALGQIDPLPILANNIIVRGVYVGSRDMFEDMNRAIGHAGLKPVIDRVFEFGAAKDAYAHLESAQHVGKIVIRI